VPDPTTNCLVCGVRIARRRGGGRPAQYCGEPHRREAEYRLRRAQSLLARAEKKLQDAGLAVALAKPWNAAETQRTLEYWSGEVERMRVELATLVEAQPGPRSVAS
jgi:hypothetical protein